MATISGTDNAFMFSLSASLRAGAGRAGYHSSSVYITVAGTNRTAAARLGTLSINDNLDHEPNTGSVTFDNSFTPAVGNAIVIQLGSTRNAERLFGGRILTTDQVFEVGDRQSVVWNCGLIDYTWELNQKLVRGRFTSQDASDIIDTLVTDFASEFTSTSRDYLSSTVNSTLGTIDEITFTEVPLADALTRIMRRVGGYWKVEYHQIVEAFTGDSYNVPTSLTDSHGSLKQPFLRKDNSQIVTRALVEGRGTGVLEQVAVGQTSIPVEDGSIWSASGATKAKGPHGQILTYTGRQTGGGDGSTASNQLAKPGSPIATDGTTVGLLVGAYQWAVTFADETGETAVGLATEAITPDTTYTPDGKWFQRAATESSTWHAIAWASSLALFAAIAGDGTNRVMTSPDGKIWTIRSAATAKDWRGLTWSEDLTLFCAVAYDAGGTDDRVMTSPDGITWTSRAASAAKQWTSVAWASGLTLFVAVADTTGTASVMTSPDGTTWTTRVSQSSNWRSVRWSEDETILVAVSSSSAPAVALQTSPDGITWNARGTGTVGSMLDSAYSPTLDLWVAIGPSAGYFTASDATSTWTGVVDVVPVSGRGIVWSVEWAQFIMVGANGPLVSSTGLVDSWSLQQEVPVGAAWGSVEWSPDERIAVALGSAGALMTQETTVAGEKVALSSIPTGGTPTTKRRLWRTKAGADEMYFLDEIDDNTTTTYTDNTIDEELGRIAPTVSSMAANDGDTTLRVQLLEHFQSGGGWAVMGSQFIRYTGRSGSSGEGTLTGIPASGTLGALKAEQKGGLPIIPTPAITGVPSSGTGSVLTQIEAGDSLNIYITRNDSSAQSALATVLGGSADGILEDYKQDRRLAQTECENRGDGMLALQKDPVLEFSYASRDPKTRSGKTITVDLSSPQSIDTTFKIQSVRISDIDTAPSFAANQANSVSERNPLYTVKASTMRFSLEDLLRQIRQNESEA